MEETRKEKYLKDSIESISIKDTEKILFQMKNCICKIVKKNGVFGTGFFFNIPIPKQSKVMPVLVTNYHILNEQDLENNKSIELILNDDRLKRTIIIDKSREKFIDENLDVIFLEIKPDRDRIKNFLDICEDVINKDINLLESVFINKSAYILHYPKGKNVQVSYGLLKDIIDDNFNHTCNTEDGSSGSPFLSLEDHKVIGIHYGCSVLNFNKGLLIKSVLNKFYQMKTKEISPKINHNGKNINKVTSEKTVVNNIKRSINNNQNCRGNFNNNNIINNNNNNNNKINNNIDKNINHPF